MEDVFRETLDLLPRSGGDLLDVGCAFGFFLEEAGRRGWRAVGIDLSPQAVALASARGLDARLVGVEAAGFADESFDAVTLFYVLEHVRDPRAVLERVYRWLRPGGTAVLRVPHTAPLVQLLDSLGVRNELLDPPHHLVDFPPPLLGRLLAEVGFADASTLPGASTRPAGIGAFMTTKVFSLLARLLYTGTFGRCLLPGVSKTTVARKPLGG
jgi:SAM-dependent methyltransferase